MPLGQVNFNNLQVIVLILPHRKGSTTKGSMTSGKIQTVLGLMDPKDAGITMTHEHLAIEFDVAYLPTTGADAGKEKLDFSMRNLGWIRQNPLSHKSNMRVCAKEEFDTIVEEMKIYKANGGCTIVDNTTCDIGRNPEYLKKVSEASGVNILAGAGYYVDAAHPADVTSRTVESIAQKIQAEVETGVDGTDIKCGVIGEIGCSWPLTSNEKKVLQASAAAQVATGCPVIIHPGRNVKAPFEIIRILQEAGGDISKTVMSHLDRTILDKENLLEFASLGSYCEWDLFGIEVSHYGPNPAVDMLSDAGRIECIRWVIEDGRLDRIVVAHDVHTKHRLLKYGGHGFSHILENVVPKMLQRGYTQAEVDRILIHNPAEWMVWK